MPAPSDLNVDNIIPDSDRTSQRSNEREIIDRTDEWNSKKNNESNSGIDPIWQVRWFVLITINIIFVWAVIVLDGIKKNGFDVDTYVLVTLIIASIAPSIPRILKKIHASLPPF